MQYRAASVVFFVVVGLLELSDFAGNVITLWDDVRLRDAAELLGITVEGQQIRLSLLLPLTALIGGLSLIVAVGALRNEYRQSERVLVTGLLFFYTVFQLLTAAVFEPAVGAFALLFAVLCILSWRLTRLPGAPQGESA